MTEVADVNDVPPESPETAALMAGAASRFLAALTDAQRDQVRSDFADEGKRRDWSFLPAPERDGLQIGALDDDQRKLAHALIVAGTSLPGYTKVVSVMAMEHVLRALTEASRPTAAHLFDPGRYSFKVFGQPGTAEPWGWQFTGHHVSLNFTVADGRYVSPTPSLLGSEPASYGTLAPLADDEELGIGRRSDLIRAIAEVVPSADFSDPSWGIIRGVRNQLTALWTDSVSCADRTDGSLDRPARIRTLIPMTVQCGSPEFDFTGV